MVRFLVPALLLLAACSAGPEVAPAPVRAAPSFGGGIAVNEADLEAWASAVGGVGLDSVQVTFYARQGPWNSGQLRFLPDDGEAVVGEIRAAHAAGLKVVLVLRTYLEHGLPENRHLWHGMIHPPDEELDAWFERYAAFVRFGADLAEAEGVEILVIGNELSSMTTTRPLTGVPQVWDYWLDPERTAKVRRDLVACADTVPEAELRQSLRWLDGHQYPDLGSALRAEEEVRRDWARRVTGWSDGRADLDAMNRRAARLDSGWRALVAEARGRYTGTLAYGANFDHFEHVGFWDELDALGVTSYFPLSRWGLTGQAREEALRDGWRRVTDGLGTVSRRARPDSPLPVYMLELGWTRKAGSTVRPWSYDRVEVLETSRRVPRGAAPELTCVHWASWPDDPTERDGAMRSLVDVVRDGDFPELRGFSLWKLTTGPWHRDDEPFAIVLPGPEDDADRALLAAAAELTGLLRPAADP